METATAEVVYLETTEEYVGIKIDRNKDKDLSEQAKKLLTDYYQTKEEIHLVMVIWNLPREFTTM